MDSHMPNTSGIVELGAASAQGTDANRAPGNKRPLFIPDRWSVGLDGPDVERFVPNKPIRTVAVQYDVFGVGGAERVALEQLKFLQGLGYRTVMYTNVPPVEGDLVCPEGVERKWAPSENDDHKERFAFWKHEVESEGIDLIIYNSWVSGWMQFDCWTFAQLEVAFVIYSHSMFTSWFADDTADYLSRALPWAAKRCAAVVCVNEATASFFSMYTDRVLLLPNPLRAYLDGVDPTHEPKGKTIVWVGRMTDEKRPDDLLPIMKRVVERHPDARLVVVGGADSDDRPQPETLMGKAKYCGLQTCIEFTGFTNPYPYYAQASVYLMTSEYEGFPLSLAEAMYFSLPCVIYDYDYLPIVKDNEGAIRVPIGDADAAGDAICDVLDDEERAAEMGRHCRDAYERVASADLVATYKQLVEAVEADEMPENLLYSVVSEPIDEKRMCDYFLQGVKLACDERHRLLWRAWGDLDRANARIAQLEKDVESLRTEMDEILNSQSYKLGNAIAAPYRLLRYRGDDKQ